MRCVMHHHITGLEARHLDIAIAWSADNGGVSLKSYALHIWIVFSHHCPHISSGGGEGYTLGRQRIKGGKTKRVNMWSAWKWLIALAVKALWWSRGEWLGKTKRLHRFTLGLHFSLVWTPFKWNALHWRWDRGDFGFVHRLFSMNLSRSLSYTKIVKRIGLCKWSGGVPDALPFFILSKLFHIDDIWYICNEINTVYYE